MRVSRRNDRGFVPISDSCIEAHVAQAVEHVLGKDEVTSSILVVGSKDGNGESVIGNRGAKE